MTRSTGNTLDDYRAAVSLLVTIAQHDTSGGRAAAQVLLGVYNGFEFHMDLTDLCVLDPEHLDAAITVLRCRALLSTEPHTLIDDGDAVFQALWEQWAWLRVRHRYSSHYQHN